MQQQQPSIFQQNKATKKATMGTLNQAKSKNQGDGQLNEKTGKKLWRDQSQMDSNSKNPKDIQQIKQREKELGRRQSKPEGQEQELR